jgi:cobalamin synthase
MNSQLRPLITAPRFAPLLGVAVGAVGGGVYWIGAQLWPTSIAVVLSMLATALLSARVGARAGTPAVTGGHAVSMGLLAFVFVVLIKYNALMGLSSASLPFAVPANLALGLIMIAGNAASRALIVSMKPASYGDLGTALAVGFAPAALVGVPGLSGLAAAILARMAYAAYVRRTRPSVGVAELDTARQLTEVCFYLGVLATRAYI